MSSPKKMVNGVVRSDPWGMLEEPQEYLVCQVRALFVAPSPKGAP